MSEIRGTNVAAPIVPFTTDDNYATHDAKYGKGGYRTVPTIADRNAIPFDRKDDGMLVYVVEDSTNIHTYRWLNNSWVEQTEGQGIIQVNNMEDLYRLTYLEVQGTVVYLRDEDKFLYYDSAGEWRPWEEIIHVGSDEPVNKNALWIDNTNQHYDESEMMYSIQKAIYALQTKVNVLMGLKTNGIVSGSVSDSARTEMMNAAEPEIPDILDPDEYADEDDEEEPDYPSGSEPTVTHISIKMGTWAQISTSLRNFINGELIWCTDRVKLYIYNNGILYAISGGGSSEEDDGMDDTRVNELIDAKLGKVESIGFIPMGGTTPKYTARVNEEGKLIVYENTLDNREAAPTGNYYYSDTVSKTGLLINSFYLGGDGKNEHDYQPCSHNFVELSNVAMDGKAVASDINLNGFYLLYCGANTASWKALPLWGNIKAGSTFLIRGKQCSVMDANTTKIKVKTYDMEWWDPTANGGAGDYIEFSQDWAVFYLCWATPEGQFYQLGESTPVNLENLSLSKNLIDTGDTTEDCAKGYIDLATFNSEAIKEKKTYTLPSGRQAKDVIFRRWYLIDPVTQSNPKDGLAKHNNVKYMTASYINGANIGEHCSIEEFTPKASWEGKTISATRSLFLEDEPNTLTCTFGIQATDNTTAQHTVAQGYGATRGFCWNSVGYFDEYLMIKKSTDSEWKKIMSVKDGMTSTEYLNTLPSGVYVPACIRNETYYNYFARTRWETSYGQSVTTHKVLLTGLTAGTYEYKVVRDDGKAYKDGNEVEISGYTYTSKTRGFIVRHDDSVTSFNFVQTTDQQGANWEEYEVWNLSARMIKKSEDNGDIPNYDFTINTGDICYNGSRSNEWIDYYRGYEYIDGKEEMLCVGNNDLAPVSMRDIGNGKESPWKINVNVIDYFYAVEIDTRNPQIFVGTSAKSDSEQVSYKIPGLYSFNYGPYHFLCILSEIRTISNQVEYKDGVPIIKDLTESTVNDIFGIKDVLRGDGSNKNASAIYDVEEGWVIRDLILWKGGTIPQDFNREDERYNQLLVDSCEKCFVYLHEMPFNITSASAYGMYESGVDAPRETAKAYMNRYHNYEYQRLFRLWGIRCIFGGHKHTPALTGPVYDAPPRYNPIAKQIGGSGIIHDPHGEDILNDKFDTSHTSGMFDNPSSFRPFLQVTRAELLAGTGRFSWNTLKEYCNEVYNNTSSSLTIDGAAGPVVLAPGEFSTTVFEYNYPKIRLEVVDSITAPSYVMCQATGFKNKSNADLSDKIIPWERFFVPGNDLPQQCYPYFTVYKVTPTSVSVDMYQIQGMYDPGQPSTEIGEGGAKAGYWDLTKIYTHGNTVEENREYFVNINTATPGACKLVLFNNTGTPEDPQGTSINLD